MIHFTVNLFCFGNFLSSKRNFPIDRIKQTFGTNDVTVLPFKITKNI